MFNLNYPNKLGIFQIKVVNLQSKRKQKRIESIKENANGLYPELRTDSDDWDVIEEQCDRDDQRKAFVLGANYVLDTIAEVINQPMNDYLVFEELKKVILQLKEK